MKNKRTFAIGDIHGCLKGLQQCLERSGFDKSVDQLIQIGDVADGWSQVPECVDELLTIKNLIAIRGNHDVWCWNWFTSGATPIIWTQQGGVATIEAYIKTGKLVEQSHRDFWNNQIDFHIDDENRLFVHAGFDLQYGFDLSKNMKVNIPNATELHWNRDLADLTEARWNKSTGKISKEYVLKFKEIFIGHTAHQSLDFNKCQNIWNIDTGAGWHGKLTIMDINTKEYWQSDEVKSLYPNELGR